MATSSKNDFVFEVRRCQPELVAPAKPTPYEFKKLSDIDDQEGFRFQIPGIFFYPHNPGMDGRDPVDVIRKALAETLVFYYPFAGRLREGPGRKLFVECTGEGVLFIEADADATLEQFGDAIYPPFACLEDVLYNVPDSDGIIDCPLWLFQVTRLKCGGFILAFRLNHTMTDAFGMFQFMNAIAEIARGAVAPSILPVWQRALLNARDPPTITHNHHEYDQVVDTKGNVVPLKDMAHRSVIFRPSDISAIRKTLPTHLRCCTSFDLITACLWRTRTIALQPDSNEEMRLLCVVNLRTKSKSLPLGYYGNAFACPAALATAGELCMNSLGYAVELVMKAKNEVTEEYMKSVADLMVIKGRPNLTAVRSLAVSDVRKIRMDEVDFGWGNAIFGGPAMGGAATVPGLTSFYIHFKNNKGEEGIVVPFSLPAPAMERFVLELEDLFKTISTNEAKNSKRKFVSSAL
ncbi:benzyl alcohol O-benzoyltransferase-like [Cucurbita pepo subsp. pepo]|uniref:benzyl alcohol O-benzoyltransferase-like n=1 Tax=Cucurbita pepo subsp. pepo TaxID=3664 RepID=UPI000C9D94EA|nr:benzyl alcohol O-benzoyltransferase-like [Cucurbita pepo subsp. pepo]